ncbi:Bgt-4333 [Blumeria graminis f. sp. tritici]|uniref:Bgt-4333 n=2 Tax=Blumeria graminis f. sp. tritici TaxID=62690 RepID=A0A381LFM3_BLUGR|nr:Pheromone-regulated protein [Blumeria graminis f. sp. tritici 96224]VCU41183.1 Bgt-4333 [Blumeria graminis f. sp. tritici]
MSSDYFTGSEGARQQPCYPDKLQEMCEAPASRYVSEEEGKEPQQKQKKTRFDPSQEAVTTPAKKTRFRTHHLSRSSSQRSQVSQHTPNQGYACSHVPSKNSTNAARGESQNPFDDPMTNPELRSQMPARPRKSLRNKMQAFNEDVDEVNTIVNAEKTPHSLASKNKTRHSAPMSRKSSFEDEEDELYPLHYPPPKTEDASWSDLDSHRYFYGAESEDERQMAQSKRSHSVPGNFRDVYSKPSKLGRWTESSSVTLGTSSGKLTPDDERAEQQTTSNTQQYSGAFLSSMMKLFNAPTNGPAQSSENYYTENSSYVASGAVTPRKATKWGYFRNQSDDTLTSATEAYSLPGPQGGLKSSRRPRLGMGKKLHSSGLIDSAKSKLACRPRLEDEIRITVHIAETLSRQNYLLKLCRSLMLFGAPTHRLEEYMRMSARVLEIQGQFLYIPGCMIISFDDTTTHTTEVKLVKTVQGVNLGLLKDIHDIYKEVVHDVIGVEEATQRLDRLNNLGPKHSPWVLVLVHGLASASVAPFAFEGRYIDLPFCFILGCILGFLQLIVAPRSDLYSNVFEITAAVLTSFLARAFGSIRGGHYLCFSAMAQSSLALILPGYMVLCGSLELQSRSMVAGSVRMVYAIIYSLFLGFGITIGTAFYGILDSNATSATTCAKPGLSIYEKWPWVPVFTLSLCIINQAKWKQTPAMLIIGFAGYIVNFFSAQKFPSSAQISNALGAFAVGVLGNLYSRMRHGVAAAALLPAIFVQVPSGLAASGSLLSGLSSAQKITNGTSDRNLTSQINGTSSVGSDDASILHPFHTNDSDPSRHYFTLPLLVSVSSPEDLNTIVFNVGYSMIQIAIGITVGLFMSALLIYPFGKRRSGLFTF